jgi:RNA polymerase sigma-70 factor (ECF subfamily)
MPHTASTPEADPAAGTVPTIPSLVMAAQSGDRWAFAQLVDRFQDAIFRMVFYRIRSQMDAEDVTQDVFLNAYQHLSRLQDAQRFKSWLFSIAVNRVKDFNRKKRFRALFGASDAPAENTLPPDTPQQPEAMEHVSCQDFWKHVGGFVETLPRMEREVFILRFMDQLSIKEVAHVMQKKENTIKTHLYRALKKFQNNAPLKQLLQEARR